MKHMEMDRILGIDTGEARIGLAVSDELGMLAHPLETVDARKGAMQRIAEVCGAKKISTIIVGHPRNMDGTYGPAADRAKKFADDLRARLHCEVKLWDERLTTMAAQKALHAGGLNTKQSRAVIDQVAAVMILQSYLDSQAPPPPPAE